MDDEVEKPLVSLSIEGTTKADGGADKFNLKIKDDEKLNEALTGAANAVKDVFENPRPVGPNTRAVMLVNGAFWQGAWAGFWTHVKSWMALNAWAQDSVAHPVTNPLFETVSSHPNASAAALGGTVAAGVAGITWLTGLMTNHGHDRKEIARIKAQPSQ